MPKIGAGPKLINTFLKSHSSILNTQTKPKLGDFDSLEMIPMLILVQWSRLDFIGRMISSFFRKVNRFLIVEAQSKCITRLN